MKKAFTLAEVLITLLIVGVLVAVTIPGLKKSSEEKTLIVGTQKAHAALNAAYDKVVARIGEPKRWSYESGWVLDEFKKELNVVKSCTSDDYSECTNGVQYNDLNGKTVDWLIADGCNIVNLADGSYFIFYMGDSDVRLMAMLSDNDSFDDVHSIFYYDVNGTAPPNILGYDLQLFVVTTDNTFLPGGNLYSCKAGSYPCTAYVLATGKMDF